MAAVVGQEVLGERPDRRVRRYDVSRGNDIAESVPDRNGGTVSCDTSSEGMKESGRAADFTYFSATSRHLSPSPPVTSIHASFNPFPYISLSSTISAKGLWLCKNMPVSSCTPRPSLSSATRSDSYLPPPFVRRMKGIRWDCRYVRAFWARGRALELRTRTPSILFPKCQQMV